MSEDDDWLLHYEDTLKAGCYHNNPNAVEILVQEGPRQIEALVAAGLQFDTDGNGQFQLGKEGAHQLRRILHADGDATGRKIVEFLFRQLTGKVTIVEREMVLDIVEEEGRCVGVKTRKETGETASYYASATVIATGGCGSLYAFSSNDSTVTGDGIALAYRAGAAIEDMEFIQFHPTMLYVNGKAVGLISEAVRGEGAVLVAEDGRKIMEYIHPQKDLAPRDIVARAIYAELIKGNKVYLDISMIPDFVKRFPTITRLCRSYGIDIESGQLPVVPGAHFLMGGIKTDINGQTSIPGLYAVGEAACTGVHGANRLASNSLLEGIVFSKRLAETLQNGTQQLLPLVRKQRKQKTACLSLENLPTKEDIQNVMMQYAGIVRDEANLCYAKQWFEQFSLPDLVNADVCDFTSEQITIINMLITGWLIITSALARTESRGGHYRSDYPETDNNWEKKRILRIRTEHFVSV